MDYKPSLAVELMLEIDSIKRKHKKDIKEAREWKRDDRFSLDVLDLVEKS